jgi:hypothetical protein
MPRMQPFYNPRPLARTNTWDHMIRAIPVHPTLLHIHFPTFFFSTPVAPRRHSLGGGVDVRGHSAPLRRSPNSLRAVRVHPDPTPSLYYKCPRTDCSRPHRIYVGSNSELDPSNPFSLILRLSLSFYVFIMFSCFIFKPSATYIVELHLSRDSILFF